MKIELRYVDKAGKLLPAKECLRVVHNGWLHPYEIEAAHVMGNDPEVTEEQAEAELQRLERVATQAHGYWEWCQ